MSVIFMKLLPILVLEQLIQQQHFLTVILLILLLMQVLLHVIFGPVHFHVQMDIFYKFQYQIVICNVFNAPVTNN